MAENVQQPTPEEEQGGRREAENVAEAAAEVVASVARLGFALAQLPIAFLPREYREEVRASARDVAQAASYFPRAMSDVLREVARDFDRGRARDAARREDLGSRLRREEREAARVARRAVRSAEAEAREAAGPSDSRPAAWSPQEEAGVEEVKGDVQEAFE